MKTIGSLLDRAFWFLLAALAATFFLTTAVAAPWGLPAFWHADERLFLVMQALEQPFGAVTETIAYPALPFTTMVMAGKALSRLTGDLVVVMAGIRGVSALLGALAIVVTAVIVLIANRSRPAALLAALLLMLSSGFFVIAHHAIVDIYLTFFVALAALLLLQFATTRRAVWLYLAFFVIGLAASSKYNGASLLLAGTIVALLYGAGAWRQRPLRFLGRIFLAYVTAVCGFLLGTPRAGRRRSSPGTAAALPGAPAPLFRPGAAGLAGPMGQGARWSGPAPVPALRPGLLLGRL